MPPYLKPLAKLTKEQMKAVLERIVANRNTPKLAPKTGGMDPTMARRMLDMPMQKENVYGQLLDRANPDKPITKTMPIKEAMSAYMEDPMRYGQLPVGPPAKHVYAEPPTGGMEFGNLGDLSRGIATERMKFANPVPASVRGNQARITQELTGADEQALQRQRLMTPNTQRSELPKHVKIPEQQMGDVIGLAVRLEDLWQAMGGGRSASANMWKMYLSGSNQKGKVKTAKDYFIASAVRNHNDPEMMAKHYPREKKLLDNMKAVYREQTGMDLDTGANIEPGGM
jgi:hypothetical protein